MFAGIPGAATFTAVMALTWSTAGCGARLTACPLSPPGYRGKGSAPLMKSRRTFAVAGCAAALAAATLAACTSGGTGSAGSSGSGSSPVSSAAAVAAAFNAGTAGIVDPSSAKGGTLSFALSGTPDSLDPGNTYSAWTWNFSRLYATPLTTFQSAPGAAGDVLVPGLAAGLGAVSPDGLTWTYHIKRGLKFSDGEPITAADVKYAVERTYDRSVLDNGPNYFQLLLGDPQYPGPYKDPNGDLTSITTPDRYTIEFHLASPFPDFNYVVSIPQTAPVPQDKDTGASYQLNPVSSGPYMFQSYSLGKQAVLVDNPNWVPQEDPQAKQLVSKITLTMNVNADDIDSRLLAGDLDVDAAGSGVQAAARAKILSSPALMKSADDAPSSRLWFIYLDTQVAPLTNVACRQAIEYAANKTALQAALGGPYAGGSVASTTLLPGMPGYTSFDQYNALSQPAGDIADAKAALARCGQPAGFTIGAAYRSDLPKEAQAAQALQAALAKVGITLELQGFPSASYVSDIAGSPNYMQTHGLGVDFGDWSPDWPDGYGMLNGLANGNNIVPTGNTNVSEENDPAVNALFADAARPGTTTARQAADYGQIDKLVMGDAAILPAVYGRNLLYRGAALTNVYAYAPYGMYNYAVLGKSS
jgi:peptide/nickel transport system substrate-binding protein